MKANPVFKLALACVLLVLAGCGSDPVCHFAGPPDTAPSAGCLVIHEGNVLLMETMGGKFGPPGGSTNAGEAAQCAAERETFEESGIEVAAGQLLATFDTGFKLYACEPVGQALPEVQRPLEVRSVGFFATEEFASLTWRFPDQAAQLTGFVDALTEKPAPNTQ